MDPDPSFMADYGDGFGYHSYPGSQNSNSNPGPQTPSNNMPPMMGYPGHPSMAPPSRYPPPGPPSSFDPSKGMYGFPGSAPPPMSSYGYPGAPPPDFSRGPPSHLSMSGPPPTSSYPPPSRLGSGMSSAFDQRAPPGLPPRLPAPVHPSAGYSGYPTGPPSSSMYGSSDPWSQRPGSGGYSYPAPPPPSALRPQTQGFPSGPVDQFGNSSSSVMHSTRPYYPPTSDPLNPYGPQSSFGPPSSSSTRGPSMSSQRQAYPSFPPGSSSIPPASTAPRFSQQQQYPPYGPSSSFSDAQSRLSPYGLQQPGSIGPNSPGYRPPFPSTSSSTAGPQVSPRRPTPTPPAGSPMAPPTSRTPDRTVSASTVSVSQSSASFPSPGVSSTASSSSSSGPPASNSLAQLEQMVGGNNLGPPNKTVVSSSPSSSSTAPNFYSSSGPPGAPYFSSTSTPVQQSNYYNNSYPSGPWSGSQPNQSTASSSNSNSVGFSSANNSSSSSVKSPLNNQFNAYDNQFGSNDAYKNDSSSSGPHLTPMQNKTFDPSFAKTDTEPVKRDRKTSDSYDSNNQSSPATSFFPPNNTSDQGGYMNNQSMYPPPQPPQSYPQNMGPYGYNESYDMGGGMGDGYQGSGYGQSSYPPGDGNSMMSGGPPSSMNQSEYPGQGMSDPYEPSPYDEPFSSEPPTKKKGKGRPKKDPMEPKKEKKPRQPRVPKSPRGRGRGRGGAANMGDRIPQDYEPSGYSLPQPPALPPPHPDMYQMHPPGPMPHPGIPPPGIPPPGLDSFRGPGMMPPPPGELMAPPPVTPINNHLEVNNKNQVNHNLNNNHSFDGLGQPPVPVPAPSMTSCSSPAQLTTTTSNLSSPLMTPSDSSVDPQTVDFGPEPSENNLLPINSEPSMKNDVIEAGSGEHSIKLPVEDKSQDNSIQSEVDMFGQSGSSSQETNLFSLPPPPSSEDSGQLPLQSNDTCFQGSEPFYSDSVEEDTSKKGKGKKGSKGPGKTKAKKRKGQEEDVTSIPSEFDSTMEATSFQVSQEIKPPKPKKPRKPSTKRKKKGEDFAVDAGLDITIDADTTSLTVDTATDADSTAILDSSTVSSTSLDDEGSQEDSTTDPNGDGSPKKKGKGKGTPKTPKKPKLKDGKSSAKKKLPKIALAKFKGRKKKKLGSSDDNSDIEKTPPPSPDETESGIQKRRSARNTKKTKYLDDVPDLDLSGDENKKDEKQDTVQIIIDDTMVVEKIMCTRMGTRELEPENEEEEARFKEGKPPTVEVEEFYVKYKNLSYLHCDWRTEEELEKGDKRINQKIKRFKMKKDNNNSFDFLDDEPFNPDYCEVDRILDVNIVEEILPPTPSPPSDKPSEDEKPMGEESKEDKTVNETSEVKTDEETKVTDNDNSEVEEKLQESCQTLTEDKPMDVGSTEPSENSTAVESDNDKVIPEEEKVEPEQLATKPPKKRTVRHYLVKWQQLSYEESTWELEDDLDPEKVKQFWRFKEVPSKEKQKHKKRPKPTEWKKLDMSPVYKNGNTLREYQLEGLNWLTFCWYNGRNCILADEMGLGKTIQSLTYINEIIKYGIHTPFLIIAPLSTIANWQREFETWTDLNVVTYHGSSASRNMLQEYEMYYKNEKGERIEGIFKFQVMITTFEIVLTDCLELRDIHFRACVIDEAHRLKNRNCKLLEGLRLLNMEHRVLLTGTPLQNNVEELFSLLNFLEPSQFASPEAFMQDFGDLKTEEQVEKLQAILKPMMLRRLKEDVEKSLAPKEETIVEVELTNIQKKYYRAILERNFQFLSKGGTYANMPNLMNTMMELRKCCIHPFLINAAEEQITDDYKKQYGNDHDAQLKCMVQASGKLVLMDKLLPRLKADGHRVLIFSQMVRCLDILEDYVVQKKYPYERIDGRVRGNLRQAAIDRYSKPGSDRFVFLLCTRAGGLGINLTAADTVIIFDSDWNPQNDLQAQARCHRIGQSKSVKIYRLICRNTYEREMFDKASLKLGLDKAVLQSMNTGQKVGDTPLTKKEVEELLRKGAYGAVMDDDNAGDKFCEEDIDQILTRRTQVITIESGEKGSTFSKASFASSENADIEIDDPNFWEKWAKKANIDTEESMGRNDLIVQEPRRRTQTKRFGQDDGVMEISDVDSSDDDEDNVSGRTRGGRGRTGRSSKKGKKGRSGYDRERDEELLGEFGPGNWARSECFKVEKALLTYGWGRWEEFLSYGNFRRNLTLKDVEDVARVILLFSIQNYKGDEKIKSFIFELISPEDPNKSSGKMSPTPRGRKGGRKPKKTVAEELSTSDWASSDQYNPELLLNDDQYKKHLNRHSNKLLLRVRLLSYLGNDIIGDLREEVQKGVHANEIPIPPPAAEGEPPCEWWDEECDKSLLIGIFKHGYDRYNLMRQDTSLCFFHRCGPPDGAALLAEIQDEDVAEDEEAESQSEAPVVSTKNAESDAPVEGQVPAEETPLKLLFPSRADLNQRLRRLITSYQKHSKRQEIRMAQQARHQLRIEKLEKFEAAIKERDLKKREQAQKKWSRREESDFYRVVSSFGVEFDRHTQLFDWNKFRSFSRLEKKVDETLTEYFRAFYAMCKRVTGRKLTEEEDNLLISVDPVSEDRANRCLARIDLLNKIREEIVPHPELDAKLALSQPSIELPDWWVCNKHDKDLLRGAAKYGLNRLDMSIMHDPDFSFHEIIKNHELENKRLEMERNAAAEAAALVKPEEEKETIPEESAKPTVVNGTSVEKEEKVSEPETSDKDVTQEEVKPEEKSHQNGDQMPESSEEEKNVKEEKIDVDPSENDVETTKDKQPSSPASGTEQNGKTNGHVDSQVPVLEETKPDDLKEPMQVNEKESDQEKQTDAVPSEVNSEQVTGLNGVTEKTEKEEVEPETKPTEHSSEDVNLPSAPLTENPALTTPVVPAFQPKALRWPKDRVLQVRLEQLVYLVEKGEWPSFRHSIYTSTGGHSASVATGDSSPRAVSPGSLSSISREPTPHPTPDQTPRRDSLSPLNDLYLFDNMGDQTRKRKRRRRTGRYPEMVSNSSESEKAKLRNLLSQNIDHQQQHVFQQQLQQREREQQARNKQTGQSLLNPSNFLSPSFLSSLNLGNFNLNHLPASLRNELLSNDKTASLLLEGLSRMQSQMGRQEQEQNLRRDVSSRHSSRRDAGGPPPPAHQSSSSRRSGNLDTLDLSRFKANPILAPPSNPPIPAHKHGKQTPKSDRRRTSPSPLSVLDLSSGPVPTKRSSRHSHHSPSSSPSRDVPVSPSSKSKRIGSRLDAIALNLQAKKMMQDPPSKGEPDFLSEIAQKSDRKKDTSRSLGNLDVLGAHLAQKQKMQREGRSTPQHPSPSQSPSRNKQPQVPSFTDILSGKVPDLASLLDPKMSGLFDPKMAALLDPKLASSLMDPKLASNIARNVDMSPFLEQTKGFKKWLEEHPEFLQQNPNLAAVAAAAMAGLNPLNPGSSPAPSSASSSTSRLPDNTELLELPEGRRRGRRPKSEETPPAQPSLPPPGLNIDENVPVIHRLTGKRISGQKAPPLKHLTEWLEKNPMFEIDPKWMNPLMRDKFSDFKVPASVSPQASNSSSMGSSPQSSSGSRSRTSDRTRTTTSETLNQSSTSKRTTAASLLAQAQALNQGSSSTSKSSSSGASPSMSSFGFPGTGLNPSTLANLNPALFGLPPNSLKMFMDQMTGGAVTATTASSSKSSSSSSTTTAPSNQNPLAPFLNFPGLGGLGGLNNPLSLFPGFNLPGFPPGFNPFEDALPGTGRKTKEASPVPDKQGQLKNEKRDKTSSKSSSANLFGSGAAGVNPFALYPNMNPNLLYPGLAGLGGLPNLSGSSPFASLAQSGLMNGLGLPGLTGQPSPSSSKKGHSSASPSGSKSSGGGSSKSGAPSGVSLSTASSLLSSTGIHPSSAAAAAAMGDSDDESLKSLMGHDMDDDLNGEMDDIPDKDDDNDSDYEAKPKRKAKSKNDKGKKTKN